MNPVEAAYEHMLLDEQAIRDDERANILRLIEPLLAAATNNIETQQYIERVLDLLRPKPKPKTPEDILNEHRVGDDPPFCQKCGRLNYVQRGADHQANMLREAGFLP